MFTVVEMLKLNACLKQLIVKPSVCNFHPQVT